MLVVSHQEKITLGLAEEEFKSLYPSRTLAARISFRDVVNHYVKTENIVSLNLVKKEGEYFEEDSKDSLQALVKKEGDSSGI